MDDVAVRTDAAGTVVRMSRRLGRGPRRPAGPRPGASAGGRGRVALTRERNGAGEMIVVARLTGEVDHASSPALLARLRREVAPGDELTVDLQEVPFIDSAGTRLVADLIERIGAARVRLVVRRGDPHQVDRAVDDRAAAPRVQLEVRD